MNNNTGCSVPLIWILLDSQSIVDLIANKKMLENISTVLVKESIRVHCNSGVKIANRVSDLPGYGTVWYKPTGIANIFLMSRATEISDYFQQRGPEFFQNGPPRQGSKVSFDP